MPWFIEVKEGPDRGAYVALSEGQVIIGRDSGDEYFTLADSSVSRKHASIKTLSDGHFYIFDLDSLNGTFINGKKVLEQALVNPGDKVVIGSNCLELIWFDESELPFKLSKHSPANAEFYDPQMVLSVPEIMAAPLFGRGLLKFLFGAALSSFPFFEFFAGGYRLRLINNGYTGKLEMPEWTDFGDLFLKGLFLFFIKAVYLLLPASMILSMVYVITSTNTSSLLKALGLSFSLFFFLLSAFLLPMAWATYAASGQVASAFQMNKIFMRIKAVLPQYVLVILIFIAIWVAMVLLAILPVIGWVLAIAGFFYAQAISALLVGNVYRFSQTIFS